MEKVNEKSARKKQRQTFKNDIKSEKKDKDKKKSKEKRKSKKKRRRRRKRNRNRSRSTTWSVHRKSEKKTTNICTKRKDVGNHERNKKKARK